MHIDTLLIQIAAVLLVGRLLGRLLRWMGQPLVIAEIVAGISLGPSLLGALWPSAMEWLFPAAAMGVLGTVAQLGLVFFMFLVGLEFDPRLLQGRARAAVTISAAGIVVPFAVGLGVAWLLPADLSRPGVHRLTFSLFVGVAMAVTAFPVLARILTERRLVKTPVGALALAAAAVDDVSAWCLLAIVVGVASASGLGSAALTLAMALVYVAVVWFVVRPILHRVGPREGTAVSVDIVALSVLFVTLSALATEWIGIHALFGGFLIGAAMPRRGGLSVVLAERMEDFVTIVLLPLFFAYSGLRTRIGLLDQASDWGLALLLLLVATVGKFGGSALAARWSGMGRRESAAIGVLMNTRGLMEIVVLNVGLDLGVISERMFAMMVLVALVTTWITSPILRRLYDPARSVPLGGPAAAGASEGRGGVLICVADPQMAEPLVRLAHALRTGPDEPVLALHLRVVERPIDYLRGGDEESPPAEPLAAVARAAAAAGIRCEELSFPSADAAEDIVRLAGERRVRLVLLGTHRTSLGTDSLRGVAGDVLRGAPCPVGVVLYQGFAALQTFRMARGAATGSAALEEARRGLLRGGAVEVEADHPAPVDLCVAAHEPSAGLAPCADRALLVLRGVAADRAASAGASTGA